MPYVLSRIGATRIPGTAKDVILIVALGSKFRDGIRSGMMTIGRSHRIFSGAASTDRIQMTIDFVDSCKGVAIDTINTLNSTASQQHNGRPPMQMQDIEFAARHSRLVLKMALRTYWEGARDHDALEELSAAISMAMERMQSVEDWIEETSGPEISLITNIN